MNEDKKDMVMGEPIPMDGLNIQDRINKLKKQVEAGIEAAKALDGLLSVRSTTCGGDYCGECNRCKGIEALEKCRESGLI